MLLYKGTVFVIDLVFCYLIVTLESERYSLYPIQALGSPVCRAVAAPQLQALPSPSSVLSAPMRQLSAPQRCAYLCLCVRAAFSPAAPDNTRCFNSVRMAECLRFGALRLSSTLLSLRAIMGTEYTRSLLKTFSLRIFLVSRFSVPNIISKRVIISV